MGAAMDKIERLGENTWWVLYNRWSPFFIKCPLQRTTFRVRPPLNSPVVVNVLKGLGVVDGKDTEEALPCPHILISHGAILLLTCSIQDVQQASFSINHNLFPIRVLQNKHNTLNTVQQSFFGFWVFWVNRPDLWSRTEVWWHHTRPHFHVQICEHDRFNSVNCFAFCHEYSKIWEYDQPSRFPNVWAANNPLKNDWWPYWGVERPCKNGQKPEIDPWLTPFLTLPLKGTLDGVLCMVYSHGTLVFVILYRKACSCMCSHQQQCYPP